MNAKRIATVLVLAFVVAAAPVAAATTVVLSIHTTTSDFNSADTLDNVTVSGGTVTYDSGRQTEETLLSDDFEDGDVSGWSGDTADFSAQTGTVFNGTYSGLLTADGTQNTVERSWIANETVNISVAARWQDPADADNEKFTFGSTRSINTRVNGGNFQNYNGTWNTVTTVSANTWYRWKFVVNSTAGTYDLYKNGTIVGDELDMETANPADTISVETAAGAADFYVDDIVVKNSGSEVPPKNVGTYISQNHTEGQVTAAFANFSINANATAVVTVENASGGAWNQVTQQTYTSGGNKSLSIPQSDTEYDYRVNVTFINETGNGVATGTLYDEGLTGPRNPPTISNPRPSGQQSSSTVTLEADVTDPDFPNDVVTVDFYVGGSQVGSDSLTSDGTASYTHTFSGSSTWYAEARDSYDATANDTTAVVSIEVPGNVSIYNESAPDTLVTEQANVTFFGRQDYVESRQTGTGSVDLSGLPGNQSYVVEVRADGYVTRTVFVEEIRENVSVYLLPENVSHVPVEFRLSDPSGSYGPRSILYIERPLNISGSTSWTTITSDEFGADGTIVNLRSGQRHRLRISNGRAVAQMGSYVVPNQTGEIVTLRPDAPAVNLTNESTVAYNASVDDSGTLHIDYLDPDNETTSVRITAANRFNSSDVIYGPQTFTNKQSISVTSPVGTLNDSYIVTFEITRGGTTSNATVALGPDQEDIVPPGLSLVWIQTAGIGLLLIVGGLFSRFNAAVGALITSLFAGVLWYIGLLQGVATWATVALAITFSVLYALVRNR